MTWAISRVDLILNELGQQVLFFRSLLENLKKTPLNFHETMIQIERVTIQSFATVAMSGFFVGAILVIQFTVQIQEFGALGFLGGLATSATIREVGPLLIAFMLSGKIGAYTAAELGTMRVTEQIDAIRCLGADPIHEIIIPRFVGIIVASFFLLSVGVFMSIMGGIVTASTFSDINPEEYLRHVSTIVTFSSICGGLFKCLVFAVMLATVCTFKGYNAKGGSRGVGQAVVQTAVLTMIGIVTTDWLTTQITDSLRIFWENIVR